MKIDKLLISGGTIEFNIDPFRARVVAAVSLILLGKVSGNLNRAVLTNADVDVSVLTALPTPREER